MTHWRFQDLEVWQLAADLAVEFHRVAAALSDKRFYRYAEQVRGAGLSIANNIAEGSASPHRKEFQQFLNIARRSAFENASMLLVFRQMKVLDEPATALLLERLDELSRKTRNLANSL